MNEALIEMWNSVVRSEDIVYFLGDWSLHPKNRDKFLSRLNGHITWIKGNHDYRSKTALELMKSRMIYYPEAHLMSNNGRGYLMVHSPFDIQRYERHIPDTARIICGHVHEKWKVKAKDSFIEAYITSDHSEGGFVTKHPIVNVGCDAWSMNMVSLEELEDLFMRIE